MQRQLKAETRTQNLKQEGVGGWESSCSKEKVLMDQLPFFGEKETLHLLRKREQTTFLKNIKLEKEEKGKKEGNSKVNKEA